MTVIINDAGHGGVDPGCSGHGMTEKTLTLEAAKYVNRRLNEHGITSSLTRETDKELTAGPRTKIVRNSGASICLCHHFNFFNGEAYGSETIHSIYSDGKLANMIMNELVKAGQHERRVFTKTYTSDDSIDYYYMHRETGNVQTVIIEYEFLDGPKYTNVNTRKKRERLYEAVVEAACKYVGVKYEPVGTVHTLSQEGGEDMADNIYAPSPTVVESTMRVLNRLERKPEGAISNVWSKKLSDGELTDSDAIGLLFVALDRELIQGSMKK